MITNIFALSISLSASVSSIEILFSSSGQPLSFASYYGDHMVLQQYKNPKVWGYANPQKIGRTVTLKVTTPDGTLTTNVTSTVVKGKCNQGPRPYFPISLIVSGKGSSLH